MKKLGSALIWGGAHWVQVLLYAVLMGVIAIYSAYSNSVVNDSWWQLRAGEEQD